MYSVSVIISVLSNSKVNISMWIDAMRILLILMTFYFCGVQLMNKTWRWVDQINEDMDIFFDRAVIIILNKPDNNSFLKNFTCLAPGVLIKNDTVLTSFNPFRKHIRDKDMKTKMLISILYKRHIQDWNRVSYDIVNFTIACARQVIPVLDDDAIWHDSETREQSPLHDLMVIRLNDSVPLLSNDPSLYNFNHFGQNGLHSVAAGPMLTVLANVSDQMGRDIKMASLGFLDKTHINQSYELRSHAFDADDNVVVNCDDWLPRQWGLFFCVRNLEHFKGVGSGALLIQNNLLFGVGSFMLAKGNSSILVFTDVREYNDLILKACTVYDQELRLEPTTTSTTPGP